MENRSYKEAVEIMINWWVEKSFQASFNQDNGDNGIITVMLNVLAEDAQKEVTPEKIEKFKNRLTDALLANESETRLYKELSVDYHPNQVLDDACQFSGISPRCLPCKTFTFINDNNEVEGRYQYGGEWFKL